MKALTVKQPWAWAIVHGGKTIENRATRWHYRGPLAIHAGMSLDRAGCDDARIITSYTDAYRRNPQGVCENPWSRQPPGRRSGHFGAILGVVDLIDVHPAIRTDDGCCQPWGDTLTSGYGQPGVMHLVLTNARPIDPIPCRGRLGLWTPPPDLLLATLRAIGKASTADTHGGIARIVREATG